MNKLRDILYILLFLLAVPLLGGLSFLKFADFRLNDRIDYNEWTADLGSKTETDAASTFFGKLHFVNMNGAVRRLLRQPYMNGIYRLNNGYLTMVQPTQTSDEKLSEYAAQTARLAAYLREAKLPFLFVAAPDSVSATDPQLPEGVTHYANDNCNRLLALLAEQGVPVMDIRAEIRADGLNHYDMMYRTDHHWTTHCGFYVYGKLEHWLKEALSCRVDERVGDIAQYELRTYPAWHLGSYGQRTGIYYAGIDDFTVYVPRFPTLLQQRGTDAAGSLEGVFLHDEPLQKKDVSSRFTYDDVLGAGGLAEKSFVNFNAENDVKLLLVSNSFYKAVYPFLIMGFEEVHYMHESSASQISPQMLTDGGYDAVILLYEPSVFGEYSGGFAFQGF